MPAKLIRYNTYKADLIIGTGISVLLFIVLVGLSYFATIKQQVNFKLGFPFIFYYQFIVDAGIQHGSMPGKFALDIILTWVITILLLILFKRRKYKNTNLNEIKFDQRK